MTDASITINPAVRMYGADVARELANTKHMPTKTAWLHEFLGRLDDDSYAIVCKYAKENPDE